MAVMARYPDKYFELAIVDPPYGIFGKHGSKNGHFGWSKKSATGGTWSKKYGDKATVWDVAPDVDYFQELERVSKERIIWGANHYGIISDNYVVWKKLTISETFSMGMCEFAHVSIKGNPKVFECTPQGTATDKRFHPCQKPIALYEWLLATYAKAGDRILDTHVGSASSLIACYILGHEAVGAELDKEYYEKSLERLNSYMAQPRLEDYMKDIQRYGYDPNLLQ